MKLPYTKLIAMAAIASAALASGCDDSSGPDGTTSTQTFALSSFNSCDDLEDYIVDQAADRFASEYVGVYYNGWGRDVAMGEEGDFGAPTAGQDDSDNEAPPTDFTETNNQEEGVDEADLVKTDGVNIYVLRNGVLHIIDSWPAETATEIARFEVGGWGENMFLIGDRVVTLTNIQSNYGWECCPECDCAEPAFGAPEERPAPDAEVDDFQGTRLSVIDVSDPADPQLLRSVDVEGSLVNARMVDGVVYTITNNYFAYDWQLYSRLYELDALPQNVWELSQEERDALHPVIVDIVRPIIAEEYAGAGVDRIIADVRIDEGERSNLFGCTDLMYPGVASVDGGVLNVFALNPNSDAAPAGTGLLASGWHVYGSPNALYIARDSRGWWWGADGSPTAQTNIHSFALNGGKPRYLASGSVDGWLLNQFSMSEHNGYLRVATTDANFGGGWLEGDAVEPDVVDAEAGGETPPNAGSGSSEPGATPDEAPEEPRSRMFAQVAAEEPPVQANNLFVLQQEGDVFNVVGEARGFGENEQVYAVRFMGDRAFVVTFRQTDPLFAIDLSVPTRPRVRGELHITGFSNYLHPIDDTHLIGLGKEADLDGRITGLQVQLFDIGDMDNPTRIAQHVIDMDNAWAWSNAEHDHHAFTWYARDNLLAIPLTTEGYNERTGQYEYFSGATVFEVTVDDGITPVGRIGHQALAEDLYCDDEGIADEPWREDECANYTYAWYTNMRRSVFIEDWFFAISDLGMTVSTIDDISSALATIPWE